MIKNNEISPFTFRNIVTSACRCKDFDWVKTFVNDYRAHLPLAVRKATYDFNVARLLYEANDYATAMPILAQFVSEDVLQNFAAKTLLLKMLFETREYEALDALLHSFEQYIRRKGSKLVIIKIII